MSGGDAPRTTRPVEAFGMLLAGTILAKLAVDLAAAFASVSHANAFGTPWMPFSDALGPWFLGGLSLHFGVPPPEYLYRPTVGLFWGALLAAGEQTAAIPLFFCAWLLAILATALTLVGDARTRLALTLGFGACVLAFDHDWGTLYVASLAIDFASLAFTVTGSVLLLWRRETAARMPLLVGCLCLGIAAAVRGPLLIAGPLMIAVRLGRVERAGAKMIAACVGIFAVPVVLDLVLQRHFGVTNNGLSALYCMYSDPAHTWSGACHKAFLAAAPSAATVLLEAVSFLQSVAGFEWLIGVVSFRVATDWATLATLPSLVLVACVVALSIGMGPHRVAGFARAGVVVASLYLAVSMGWRDGPFSWVLLALGAAAAMRSWRAFLLLAGYLSGTAFLAAFGLAGLDRLQNTFSFMLPLGTAFLVLGEPAPPATPPGRAEALAPAAVATAIAYLYLGWMLPSGWKDAYLANVQGSDTTALKVADDPRLDRSLYYLRYGSTVFVRHDDHPVGAVRVHRGLARPERANDTFDRPNAFLD